MTHHFQSTLVGEALVGEGPEIAHIDLVIGKKGGAVEQAFIAALSSPAKGHTPLLAVLEPNLPAKPSTLMVNKVTIKGADQAILPEDQAEDILIIVSVFIEWDAKDKKKVYEYNYQATKFALERAITGKPTVQEVLSKKDSAKHPFA
jgi:5,6,7,8-tetrahydromethanopterin hydro-lyase